MKNFFNYDNVKKYLLASGRPFVIVIEVKRAFEDCLEAMFGEHFCNQDMEVQA